MQNKIVYLASGNAKIEKYNKFIKYNDAYIKRDIAGCMLSVDLSPYSVILASPPCNYYSKANYRREQSKYALDTKHLLPDIIKKLVKIGKPFIVENVKNKPLMQDIIKNNNVFYYEHGRHSYFTNRLINLKGIPQVKENLTKINTKKRQGGYNVNVVFEQFLNLYFEPWGD